MAETYGARGGARTTQEERSQRTRERLADAAIECLVESGYRGTTFVEVCRRAGLTRGAAHHHYRDLPALLHDVMERLNERLVTRVGPVLGEISDTEKRIDAGIDILWELFRSRDFRAVVEIWVAQSHDEDLRTRIRTEMERSSAAIAAGFGQTFPELMHPGGGDGALLMMRFAFLVMMGIGFVDVTIGPPQDERERARMLGLLKKVVQREAALMRIDEFQFSAA